jgi:hypothetical protein
MQYLKRTSLEDNMQTHIYRAAMWHKELAYPLNVVIMVKINLKTQARAHVVLCSSELNFRDAKQYWGAEDFMNVRPTAVNNAAHLAVLVGNIAHLLLKPFRKDHPKFGILDLKASFRGQKYESIPLIYHACYTISEQNRRPVWQGDSKA